MGEGDVGRVWLTFCEGGGEITSSERLSFSGSSPAGVVDEPVSGEPPVSPPQGDFVSSSSSFNGDEGNCASPITLLGCSEDEDEHLCNEGLVEKCWRQLRQKLMGWKETLQRLPFICSMSSAERDGMLKTCVPRYVPHERSLQSAGEREEIKEVGDKRVCYELHLVVVW